jgi:hypothetical protein
LKPGRLLCEIPTTKTYHATLTTVSSKDETKTILFWSLSFWPRFFPNWLYPGKTVNRRTEKIICGAIDGHRSNPGIPVSAKTQ